MSNKNSPIFDVYAGADRVMAAVGDLQAAYEKFHKSLPKQQEGRIVRNALAKETGLSPVEVETELVMREATVSDVQEGAVIYFVGDYGLYRTSVVGVLNPHDPYKGFVGSDGCRYGIHSAFVLLLRDEDEL